ncbi:hypothetical protein RJ640_002238 [Escallonia rubra]|uniref:Protein kinase domain-containing protein n=1 Tax=Escallonia rubra TaxID=112253 RepID=A0AA88RQJ9_9ASTE|nr:hypothetical protein RJ640_002238 [Escallonia rubra]
MVVDNTRQGLVSCPYDIYWKYIVFYVQVVNMKNQGYGLAADIWSLGCTVLEMLTRQLPYSPLECRIEVFKMRLRVKKMVWVVVEAQIHVDLDLSPGIGGCQFAGACVTVVCFPFGLWMQALFRIGRAIPPPVPDSLSEEARHFILQCLQVNPDARPTAAQLLDHPFVKRPLSLSSGSASPHNPWRRI